MVEKDRDLKFGDVLISNVTLEKANKIRSYIKKNSTSGYWVFVMKDRKTGKYNLSAQNNWGLQLDAGELKELKAYVKLAKQELKG